VLYLLNLLDVCCGKTLGALLNRELNTLTFGKALETVAGDSRIMNENITTTAITSDKAEALGIVKLLYAASFYIAHPAVSPCCYCISRTTGIATPREAVHALLCNKRRPKQLLLGDNPAQPERTYLRLAGVMIHFAPFNVNRRMDSQINTNCQLFFRKTYAFHTCAMRRPLIFQK